jgi:Na+-transporting methylmalonyl-CoA/oxaloacetate decarboxylase gamma subunit
MTLTLCLIILLFLFFPSLMLSARGVVLGVVFFYLALIYGVSEQAQQRAAEQAEHKRAYEKQEAERKAREVAEQRARLEAERLRADWLEAQRVQQEAERQRDQQEAQRQRAHWLASHNAILDKFNALREICFRARDKAEGPFNFRVGMTVEVHACGFLPPNYETARRNTHASNWWEVQYWATLPVPTTEAEVLANAVRLKSEHHGRQMQLATE